MAARKRILLMTMILPVCRALSSGRPSSNTMAARKRILLMTMILPVCRALSSGRPSSNTIRPPIRAIMSDIDGTLVHYCQRFTHHGVKLVSSDEEALTAIIEGPNGDQRHCRLLPSATMGPACISERTIQLVEIIRDQGVMFCVLTAARKSTMMRRLDMLPTCDAVVCEGGSRMMISGQLETEYSNPFEDICGPMDREVVGEGERPEPLWQYYRQLEEHVPGLKLDAKDYYGMFRVSALGDEATEDALQGMLQPSKIPQGVSVNSNLGKTDLFPSLAGKANAVKFLQKKYGIDQLETACLFDDDNDLLMAEHCGLHFLPSLTSFSIKNAVSHNPSWYIPKTVGQGVFATEECLEAILARVVADQRIQENIEELLEKTADALPEASLKKNQTAIEEK